MGNEDHSDFFFSNIRFARKKKKYGIGEESRGIEKNRIEEQSKWTS